jgi:hypothetical protein
MPRWNRRDSQRERRGAILRDEFERGAASLVFVVLILPLLLVLLVITIDIATFFSVREEVRTLLDEEAQGALARRSTTAQLQASIKRRLERLNPFLNQPAIATTVLRDSSVLSMRAGYHSVLIDLCGGLLLKQLPSIPLEVEVRSRKFSSMGLIVFDRTVSRSGIECSDAELREVTNFASRMVAAFEESGVRSVKVAFTPGIRNSLDVLGDIEGFQGCNGVSVVSPRQVGFVPGAARSLPSSLDLGAEIERIILSQRGHAPTERLGLVTIVRGAQAGNGYIHSTVDQLDAMTQRNEIFLSMVHFGVNPVGAYRRPSYRPSYYGVRWREVLLESRQMTDPRLLTASLGHLGNDVHISR